MDLALRTLRAGAPAGQAPAPLVVLEDSLDVLGGLEMWRKALADLSACLAGGRSQATHLTVVALARPPAEYLDLCSALPASRVEVIDCYTDPYGWLGGVAGPPGGGNRQLRALPSVLASPQGLAELVAALGGAPLAPLPGLRGAAPAAGPDAELAGSAAILTAAAAAAGNTAAVGQPCHRHRCLAIDSLSRLVDAFGGGSTARALLALQRAPATSCLLGALHGDLHAPHEAGALRALASCVTSLAPAPDGPGTDWPGAGAAHGRVVARCKTRAGRVRTESKAFGVDGWAEIRCWAPPQRQQEPPDRAPGGETAGAPGASSQACLCCGARERAADPNSPRLLAGRAAAEPAAAAALPGGGAALAARLAGGMRLELSREEEEARRAVALPYEHQGQGARYQTGDFRQYLPPEAGGTAGSLGRIMYVRDSESEPDSDEDPDDDLDI